VDDLDFTDATTVTVTGAGNATLAGINLKDATSTFDASAATGDLTLTFEDVQTQTIKTGSGKDNVKLDHAALSAYDVFDLGDGADKLTIQAVNAATTATLNASNVETLIFETAASGSIDMDLSKATSVKTIVIDDGGLDGVVKFDFVQSGTTIQFADLGGDNSADTHVITGVTGAAELTIDVTDVDGSTTDTYDINNFTTINLNQKDNTLASSGASVLADLDTGDATTLNITAANDALTLTDLSTAKLTTLKISGSTDVTISGGGSTTITSIDASGLSGTNNGAELDLGGTSGFARAATAEITGSDGADSITMSASAITHAGNVIDAGSNATVTTGVSGVKGDTLVMYGTMTGDSVVDLSSTTDQLTSLSAVSNSAVQKGFESFDGSNATMTGSYKFTITGSDGINHITGGSNADVINGGAGNDVIYGSGGADIIDGGTGNDTFVGGAGADVITAGDGTDVIVYTTHTETLNGTSTPDVTGVTADALTGADLYYGFGAGDKIDVSGWSAYTAADGTTNDSTTELGAATDGGVAIINGAYNTTTKKFVEDGSFSIADGDNDYFIQFADGTNIISFVLVDVAAEIDSLVGVSGVYTLTT